MSKGFIIGLTLVLVGLVALFVPWTHVPRKPHLIAHVEMPLSAARQLREGTPVYVRGVTVGYVEKVPRASLSGASDVVLHLDAPVTSDANVSFNQMGLLADVSLEIEPGIGEPLGKEGKLRFSPNHLSNP